MTCLDPSAGRGASAGSPAPEPLPAATGMDGGPAVDHDDEDDGGAGP